MDQIRTFSDLYYNFLQNDLKGINLTSIKNSEDFYYKQIVDSLLILKSPLFNKLINERMMVDVGFGGGLPLIPLSYKLKEATFLGIEAKEKKVVAVRKIINYFNINNVTLEHARFENRFWQKVVILFKAVGKIDDILKKIKGKDVYVAFYKGPNVNKLESLQVRGWKLCEDNFLELQNSLGRRIIFFHKSN